MPVHNAATRAACEKPTSVKIPGGSVAAAPTAAKRRSALTRKYGSLCAERTLAAYRRNHPSRLEQEVASLLAYVPDLKACHREYEIQDAANRAVYVDFLVVTNDGRRVALEVDGDYWHPCGPDPGRDAIIRQHAHLVIYLTQNEIDSQHALDLLRLSIQP